MFAAFSAATPLRRLLRQLVRGVQRRDLVALRQRWIVEDGPQEIVEAPAEGEHGLADVNELGGARPDGVHTQQTPVLAVEEELEQPAVVPQDLAAGDLAVARHPGLVRDLPIGELALGGAHHRDLGDGVDPDREVAAHRWCRDAEGVTGGEPALLGRGGSKARIADDVACCEDVGDPRPEFAVDLEPPALVRFQADGVEVQVVGGAQTAHREEHEIRHDPLARLEQGHRPPAFAVGDLQTTDGLAEPKRHVAGAHLVHELVDDLTVEELERPVTLVHQDDGRAERGQHRRVLHADDAAAHHGDGTRKAREARDVITRRNYLAVHRHSGWRGRPGAHGDEDVGGGDRALAALTGQGQGVRVGEHRVTTEHAHAVALQLVAEDLGLPGHHAVDPVDELGGGRAHLRTLREVEHGLPERLAGDGAAVQTDSAHHALALDEGGALAKLGGLDGGALTGWPAADAQQVEVDVGHQGRYRPFGLQSERENRQHRRRPGRALPRHFDEESRPHPRRDGRGA